jgi:galactose mutarotase-like enzyme
MQLELCSFGASVRFDTLGGEMVGYIKDGVSYAWQGDPAYWSGHAPVLFPVVCSLKNDSVVIEGKQCNIPKHGIARKREFSLLSKTEDSVVFALKADEEGLSVYPFHFELTVTHSLLKNGFQTTYTVTNADSREMPFCIGGHPGFCCPLHDGERFEEYELLFDQTESIKALYTDNGTLLNRNNAVQLIQDGRRIPLRYADFDRDAFILDGLRSRGVRLVHKDTGKGLHFTFDGFSALGVWTPPLKKAPFLCLEPWAGLPALTDETGNFLDKPYAMVLQPGKVRSFSYAMEIIR